MGRKSVSRASIARAVVMTAISLTLAGTSALAAPHALIKGMVLKDAQMPPTDEYCRVRYGSPCYSPQEIRRSYGLDRLIDAGMVGAGQTIVIIDSYGSPTIAADLTAFDAGYGLPDPPSFTVLAPLGTVPWDPTTYPDQPGWAGETTLDVEWAHAMAPGASIVLLTSPVSETEGVQGLPQFLALEQYALDHHLGKIISQSWSATENTLFIGAAGPAGPKVVEDFMAFYKQAAAEQVTVLAAAGDDGSSNPEIDGSFYPMPTVGFPSSSPWVTSVGGTSLYADIAGRYQSEVVWSDSGCCAGGGGISQIFKEPAYQQLALPAEVSLQLGGMRGVPDVSYNADCFNAILVYLSFEGADQAGYYGICGTSEGAPQWAGIIADLSQYAGKPLGFLNPALYALGATGRFGTLGRDIVSGNNALIGVPGAVAPGYSATAGWDPASGWGSPNLIALPTNALELLEH